MSTIFTLPTGTKVRTATNRRYVLVLEYSRSEEFAPFAAIEKRSDNPETLRTYLRRQRSNGYLRGCKAYLGDTATKTTKEV